MPSMQTSFCSGSSSCTLSETNPKDADDSNMEWDSDYVGQEEGMESENEEVDYPIVDPDPIPGEKDVYFWTDTNDQWCTILNMLPTSQLFSSCFWSLQDGIPEPTTATTSSVAASTDPPG